MKLIPALWFGLPLLAGAATAALAAVEPVVPVAAAVTVPAIVGRAASVAPAAVGDASACGAVPLSRETLQAQVAGLLQATPGQAYERVAVELVGALPAGVTAPRLALKSAWPAARVAVELRWDACGQEARKLAWFKAQAWRQAWVYGRDGTTDSALQATLPEQRLVDMAQWRLPVGELVAAPAGEFLARPVKAGAPLRQGDLKPAPLVRRNERVTVLVQGRGLQLRTGALALQYGADGEWIAVMVDGAEKSMRARVVAPGVVHVDI